MARAVGDGAARQLANTTKTPPQLTAITPRWLVQLLSWVPVESGTYRVNKVKNDQAIEVDCGSRDERTLPETFVDYVENPREYTLSAITTIVDVHTRVSDLFSHPHDQIREQVRLTVEKVKERQEYELINNSDYGLLNNVDPAFKIQARQERLPPMIWMSCSRASGRSRLSSWPIHAPSPPSGGSAPTVVFLLPRQRFLDRLSYLARHSAHPYRQARHRRGREEQYSSTVAPARGSRA